MTTKQRTLLVTGASGRLGTRVVELLFNKKPGAVIAGSRTPDKLRLLAGLGATLRKVDFDDPLETLVEAFTGVDRMLLISTDSVDPWERRFQQHERAIQAAKQAGVTHIVYTSFAHPDADSAVSIASDHRRTEEALAASGLSFTALRNNIYTDSLLQHAPAALATGQLFGASGEDGAAYVTREDCAKAAAAALAMFTDGQVTLEVTGPAVVSYTQVARLLREISGQNVTHVPLKAADRRAELIGAGFSLTAADILVSIDAGMAQRKFGPPTAVVRELTGRAPTSVAEFLSANKRVLADGVPSANSQ